MTQSEAGKPHRHPPPRFAPKQNKSESASDSSDAEQADSSEEEAEQSMRAYQVCNVYVLSFVSFVRFCKSSNLAAVSTQDIATCNLLTAAPSCFGKRLLIPGH